MTLDVTTLNAPPPTTTLLLGTPVRCADGAAGTVDGVVINPSAGSFEYILVRAADQHPHFVPRGRIAEFGAEITVDMNCAELQHQPEPSDRAPGEAGLLTSHLDNLCIATSTTPVVPIGGTAVGNFAGIVFAPQTDYMVREVLLQGGAHDRVQISNIDPGAPNELWFVPLRARQGEA